MSTTDLRRDFEELLYYEAWLLDHDRLEEWLELFTEDLRYWAPIRSNLERGKEDLTPPDPLNGEWKPARFDDTKRGIIEWAQKMRTGSAWVEDPPSRYRHLITNVRVLEADDIGVKVGSNFAVFRSKGAQDETWYVGYREDRWRREGEAWKCSERCIIFDHDVQRMMTTRF